MNPAKITILAPGLIGGSVALAATKAFPKAKIAVWTRRQESLPSIRTVLPKADVSIDPSLATDADLVVLGSPPSALPELVRSILPFLKPSALVTDVASIKGPLENIMAHLLQNKARWIGSHPMAGSEESGIAVARADLFQNAPVILTPTPTTPADVTRDATSFWQALGARVLTLTPQAHDEQIARISHLPHLIASALVLAAGHDSLPLAGSGYRDTTRVAAGPSELWSEILCNNRLQVLASLKDFRSSLNDLVSALKKGDASALAKILDDAAKIRRTLPTS
ncbi:MAG: prephenate dehydrogenase/arogenate dehydrogenase family protein [Verrucomicrobia bacterium]|nr:prephenate dehydrogenase/arogenate dehydrogenase family protein [Verrucomicrobiota bacterium]